jgi:hypothetical protein
MAGVFGVKCKSLAYHLDGCITAIQLDPIYYAAVETSIDCEK